MAAVRLAPLLAWLWVAAAGPVTFRQGGYEGVVVRFADSVPAAECRSLLQNLETALTGASRFLHSSLDGRAYLASVTVLLPDSWSDSCTPRHVVSSSGEAPDLTVGPAHPIFGQEPWTQQSRGCGRPGDMVHLSYERLRDVSGLDRLLVQQWAKYRYGVFDEVGYVSDPVYPLCHQGDTNHLQVTGCSDLPIQDTGVCDGPSLRYNASLLVHSDATSSVLFAATAPQVTRFCDAGTHNRYAPTKQNLVCDRRSAMDVILQHPDFANNVVDELKVANTTPSFHYKRRSITRYVLVIEDTKDMYVRESWSFLMSALRKWAVHDLPESSEAGLVLANETSAIPAQQLLPLSMPVARDLVASSLPYLPGDSHSAGCLQCGIRAALQMLKERASKHGPASSVIVLIAPGMDHSLNINSILAEAANVRARIATINYPYVSRERLLDALAHGTGAPAFTVQEERQNMHTSLLTTYFRLATVLHDIASHFYQGSSAGMPIEIHRRELLNDGTITGSFMLDESLGEPATFAVFTHSIENPLIKGITLVSPSQAVYTQKVGAMLLVKLISMQAALNETGTWVYTVERYSGNPQPHFVQVMATPRSPSAPVVKARAWTSQGVRPLVIYTEVRRGDYPVLGARVEVVATRPAGNGSSLYKNKLELLDTGSGDPDLTRGDGVYSRYFNPMHGGPGMYMFEVTVTDNGNTAYAWHETFLLQTSYSAPTCCGSVVPTPPVEPLSAFQRILPPISVTFTMEDVASQPVVGRIGDLKVEVIASDLKARLTWTAPDMGGHSVTRYEVKYAHSVVDIVDRFDSAAETWDYGSPFPLPPGSETAFTLDFTRNPSLLDIPLFASVRGFADGVHDYPGGPPSNWVRVLVPSPPPPPPPPSTAPTTTYDHSSWLHEGAQDEAVVPRIDRGMDFGVVTIVVTAASVMLILVLLVTCCCWVLVRRRQRCAGEKHKSKQLASPTVVPSSPQRDDSTGEPSPQQERAPPPQYEPYIGDEKKRFSLAQMQEEPAPQPQLQPLPPQPQMHEQVLPPQQHRDLSPQVMPHPNGGISTISSNGAGGTLPRGRTLSPYQSWTASQLLHEHERRQSPYGGPGDEGHPQHPPPVPPLPAFGHQHPGPIYGVHPGAFANGGYQKNGSLVPFNPSLQGSLSSVSSGDRKKRNVTMV
ncbi:calcium-activated chloride channel regulator 4-like [Bacillus rossius redtenbacheri]|uniref:calcium-activated chloride channel regulator 4-like n=1 Tax=Bacillus rossius redtenbacheri TaxID=93214 RepID=UPI002FDED2C0